MFILAVLFTLSLMVLTRAAPTTITSTDLSYCSKTTNNSDVDIQKLYEESDVIFDEVLKLCSITVSAFTVFSLHNILLHYVSTGEL